MRVWNRVPSGVQRVHRIRAEVLTCDAATLLGAMRDEVADIVFMDPPFNLGKRYGSRAPAKDRKPQADYQSFIQGVLDQAVRVLKPGGALFLYHLPFWGVRFASHLMETLDFRHWVAISMKNGYPKPGRLYPAHYALLYFTKSTPASFQRPKIPAPRCRHCDKYIKDYGGHTRFVTDGINLSDFWDDVSPVRHKPNKHRSANQLPEVIAERVVHISGFPKGVFVDPFAGTGTALVVAHRHGMRVIGSDLEPGQAEIAIERIAHRERSGP